MGGEGRGSRDMKSGRVIVEGSERAEKAEEGRSFLGSLYRE